MSAFYEQLRAEAYQLLADLGRDITFRRYAYSNDLVEGISSPVLSDSQTLKGATLPMQAGVLSEFDIRPMQSISAEVRVCYALVSAEGAVFMPGYGDEAEFGGKVWSVVGCTPLDVDGTEVIYTVGFQEA